MCGTYRWLNVNVKNIYCLLLIICQRTQKKTRGNHSKQQKLKNTQELLSRV